MIEFFKSLFFIILGYCFFNMIIWSIRKTVRYARKKREAEIFSAFNECSLFGIEKEEDILESFYDHALGGHMGVDIYPNIYKKSVQCGGLWATKTPKEIEYDLRTLVLFVRTGGKICSFENMTEEVEC